MREIGLTQGQVALVDDEDFDRLSQHKWFAQATQTGGFYAARYDVDHLVLMHREVNNTPGGLLTDHRDANGLHNWRSNLRTATPLQNMMNRRGKRGGTSRFKGVWADPNPRNRKLWRSAIRLDGRLKYLGRFHTEEEAASAYAIAAATHFGEFACHTPGDQPK